jgi:hypothetical protein
MKSSNALEKLSKGQGQETQVQKEESMAEGQEQQQEQQQEQPQSGGTPNKLEKAVREHSSKGSDQQQIHDKSPDSRRQGDTRTPGSSEKSSGEKQQQSHDRSRPDERRRSISTRNALDKAVREQKPQQQEKQLQRDKQEHYDKQTSVTSPSTLEKSSQEQETQAQFERTVDKRLEARGLRKNDPAARTAMENIIRMEADAARTAHMPLKEGEPNPDYQFEHLQGNVREAAEKVQKEYSDLQRTKMGGLYTTTMGSRLDEYRLLRDSADKFSLGLNENNQIVLEGSRKSRIDLVGGDKVLDQVFEMTTEKIADKFLGEGAERAIQLIGFAKTLSEVIKDEKEMKMLNYANTSQEAKEWRLEKTISLLAEKRAHAIAISEWRANRIDVNRNALSADLERNYHDADKIVKEYTHYIELDQRLKKQKAGISSEGPSYPTISSLDR